MKASDQWKSLARKADRERLENNFLWMWNQITTRSPVREHRFHPTRRWRFDFAWPKAMLAVEIEGGVWKGKPCPACGRRGGGRHNHPSGFEEDAVKRFNAAVLGWVVIHLTERMITLDHLSKIHSILVLRDKWAS